MAAEYNAASIGQASRLPQPGPPPLARPATAPRGKVGITGGMIAGLAARIPHKATIKRFVNDGVLPKGPAELAARYGAEPAAVRNSADAAKGVRAFREKRRPRRQGR